MGRSLRFLEALRSRVLVGDGAMGTELHARGFSAEECYESLNSKARDAVREVLAAYVEAGADVIETNTFRANRTHLAAFGFAEKVFEFNYRGARLARQVAGREVFVAGCVGPLSVAVCVPAPASTKVSEYAYDPLPDRVPVTVVPPTPTAAHACPTAAYSVELAP